MYNWFLAYVLMGEHKQDQLQRTNGSPVCSQQVTALWLSFKRAETQQLLTDTVHEFATVCLLQQWPAMSF